MDCHTFAHDPSQKRSSQISHLGFFAMIQSAISFFNGAWTKDILLQDYVVLSFQFYNLYVKVL